MAIASLGSSFLQIRGDNTPPTLCKSRPWVENGQRAGETEGLSGEHRQGRIRVHFIQRDRDKSKAVAASYSCQSLARWGSWVGQHRCGCRALHCVRDYGFHLHLLMAGSFRKLSAVLEVVLYGKCSVPFAMKGGWCGGWPVGSGRGEGLL